MHNKNKKLIGFWGYPHPDIIKKTKTDYPDHDFVDLDIDYGYPNSNIVPEAYCKIIRNIVDNSIHLKDRLDVILAAVGEEKCDSGRFASYILKEKGFNIVESSFEDILYDKNIYLPVSTSSLPLDEKLNAIMDGIIMKQNLELTPIKPTHGFWGVPPNDFSFLSLFPNSTHLYGWTRCVEAKVPADLELEMYVDENVPTVFFAQAFCSKMQLAKYLAKKHNGLYIDVDDLATNSIKAKLEAFIRLG